MQFPTSSITFLLIFIICCNESTLSLRLHHQGRSAASGNYHVYPLYRKEIKGRSAEFEAGSINAFDIDPLPPIAAGDTTNGDGRDFMKKFLLFKSMFQQSQPEPSNNVIIITQPAPTTTTTMTTPSTTSTTSPTTTSAATTTSAGATPSTTTAARDGDKDVEMNDMKLPLIDDKLKEVDNIGSDNSRPEDIVQQLLKQTTKPKKIQRNRNKNRNLNRKNLNKNQKKQRQRIKRLRKRNKARKRLQQQQRKQQQQKHKQQNNVDAIIANLNSSKKPHQNSNSSSNNNKNSSNIINSSSINSSSSNNASGALNLNTNMRLQNIMNAFRHQTPIIYNY